jgi:predicted transcriptional regulator
LQLVGGKQREVTLKVAKFPELERLYSVERTAELLGGVSHWAVRSWLRDRRLEKTYVGGRVMISESAIQRFLAESEERRRKKKTQPKPAA